MHIGARVGASVRKVKGAPRADVREDDEAAGEVGAPQLLARPVRRPLHRVTVRIGGKLLARARRLQGIGIDLPRCALHVPFLGEQTVVVPDLHVRAVIDGCIHDIKVLRGIALRRNREEALGKQALLLDEDKRRSLLLGGFDRLQGRARVHVVRGEPVAGRKVAESQRTRLRSHDRPLLTLALGDNCAEGDIRRGARDAGRRLERKAGLRVDDVVVAVIVREHEGLGKREVRALKPDIAARTRPDREGAYRCGANEPIPGQAQVLAGRDERSGAVVEHPDVVSAHEDSGRALARELHGRAELEDATAPVITRDQALIDAPCKTACRPLGNAFAIGEARKRGSAVVRIHVVEVRDDGAELVERHGDIGLEGKRAVILRKAVDHLALDSPVSRCGVPSLGLNVVHPRLVVGIAKVGCRSLGVGIAPHHNSHLRAGEALAHAEQGRARNARHDLFLLAEEHARLVP